MDVDHALGLTARPQLGRSATCLAQLRRCIAPGAAHVNSFWAALTQKIRDMNEFFRVFDTPVLACEDDEHHPGHVEGLSELVSFRLRFCEEVEQRVQALVDPVEGVFEDFDRYVRSALCAGATHEETQVAVKLVLSLFDRALRLMEVVSPIVRTELLDEVIEHERIDNRLVHRFRSFDESIETDLARRLESLSMSEMNAIVGAACQALRDAEASADAVSSDGGSDE